MKPIRIQGTESDPHEIRRAIRVLFPGDTNCELRILKATNGQRQLGTVSGYYDGQHRESMAVSAERFSGLVNVYVLLNPALPDLLARANNRCVEWARVTTKDDEIVRRRWLLIDIDPKRPAGISSTNEEHEAALSMSRNIRDWLTGLGWPPPILADSGNGAHLLYRIDLPNDRDAAELLKRVLAAIAAKWSNEAAEVDRTVYNAARICKLYGTVSVKGDDTPERPHRISRMLDVPDDLRIVTREQLEQIDRDDDATAAIDQHTPKPSPTGHALDLAAWLERCKVPVAKSKSWGDGGTLYELSQCPFRPDQPDGGAWIGQAGDGRIYAKCHHNKCNDKSWLDFRDIYEPGWRQKPTPADSSGFEPIEADDDPHRLARLYHDQHCTHVDGQTLIYWRGSWLKWNGVFWEPLSSDEMKATLGNAIKVEFDRLSIDAQLVMRQQQKAKKVTTSLVTNVMLALQGMVGLSAKIEPPAWIDDDLPWPANEAVIAANGIVHLPSLLNGDDFLLPHSPRFLATAALHFDVIANPNSPARWRQFLRQLFGDDDESLCLLQQWFGYCLTGDTSQQKILMMIGPKRSGKGTIARVLTLLVGKENVANPTPASFHTDFGLQPLLGKTLAIMSDARFSGRLDSSIIAERLLSISGEDALTVDRKHTDSITTKLCVRFMILSNELPRVIDASGALASRMLILPLTNSFYGREDTELTAKLECELPGIFLWAVEGWKSLLEHGRFVEPESASVLRSEVEEIGSPVVEFVHAWCETDPLSEESIARLDLFKAYKEWCRRQGHRYVEQQSVFGKNLHAAYPYLLSTQPREDGERRRHYVGIDLKPMIKRELQDARIIGE